MYGYYFLTALGVQWVKVIKPYITRAQIGQFLIIAFQNVVGVYYSLYLKREGYPLLLNIMLSIYMVTMLVLFGNFYIQDRKQRQVKQKAN
jgi:elongation of very long chain fatty acids protein 4